LFKQIQNELNAHKNVVEKTLETLQNHIYTASIIIREAVKNGNKVYLFGNGKNSITAQYFSSNFAENISSDAVILTDLANTYDFDRVYEKQIEKKANKDDILIGISTSGNSKNILRGLSLGSNIGCKTIGLSGYDGGALHEFCDVNLVIPSDDISRIQEMHIVVGHIIFQVVKDSLSLEQ